MRICDLVVLLLAGAEALTTESEKQAFLATHNELRALHSAPEMRWDVDAAEFAQNHCDVLRDNDELKHSDSKVRRERGFGENLYYRWATGSDPRVGVAGRSVQSWYDEIKLYKYGNPGFSVEAGHFTQVVWSSSVRLGCAISDKSEGGKLTVWICCNYSPPGNYLGQFQSNVLPLKEEDDKTKEEAEKKKEKKRCQKERRRCIRKKIKCIKSRKTKTKKSRCKGCKRC